MAGDAHCLPCYEFPSTATAVAGFMPSWHIWSRLPASGTDKKKQHETVRSQQNNPATLGLEMPGEDQGSDDAEANCTSTDGNVDRLAAKFSNVSRKLLDAKGVPAVKPTFAVPKGERRACGQQEKAKS